MGPRLNHWIRGEKRVRVSDWPESCALARMGVVVPRCWVDSVTLADRADYVRLGIAMLGITGLPNLHIILEFSPLDPSNKISLPQKQPVPQPGFLHLYIFAEISKQEVHRTFRIISPHANTVKFTKIVAKYVDI